MQSQHLEYRMSLKHINALNGQKSLSRDQLTIELYSCFAHFILSHGCVCCLFVLVVRRAAPASYTVY